MHHRSKVMTVPKKIAFVMRMFDFEKAHGVMVHLGWTWHLDGHPRIPTVEELKVQATAFLEEVTEKPVPPQGFAMVRGGGLMVFWDGDLLRLIFEVQDAWYCNQRVY